MKPPESRHYTISPGAADHAAAAKEMR